VRLFTEHQAPVYSLASSPDGHFFASSGDDKDITLWDLGTSKRVATLKGHTKTVWSLDFCKGGSHLASGGADGTIRLWDMRMVKEDLERRTKDNGEGTRMKGRSSVPDTTTTLKQTTTTTTEEFGEQEYCFGVYHTKRTPIFNLQWTSANILCAAGPYYAKS